MNIDLKKLLKPRGSVRVPIESLVRYALYASCAVFAILLILDAFIFYQYSYSVVSDSPESDYSIKIEKSLIGTIVAGIKERQDALSSLKGGSTSYPDPFR